MKLFLFIFRSIRHYWVSLLLNLIGLSIAFSIFFVLFNQVQFEWNYDGFYKDSDRIYVLASKDTVNNDYTASFQVPFILHVGSNAPHIEAYTFQYAQFWGQLCPMMNPELPYPFSSRM